MNKTMQIVLGAILCIAGAALAGAYALVAVPAAVIAWIFASSETLLVVGARFAGLAMAMVTILVGALVFASHGAFALAVAYLALAGLGGTLLGHGCARIS
jgi:hypothetical protein